MAQTARRDCANCPGRDYTTHSNRAQAGILSSASFRPRDAMDGLHRPTHRIAPASLRPEKRVVMRTNCSRSSSVCRAAIFFGKSTPEYKRYRVLERLALRKSLPLRGLSCTIASSVGKSAFPPQHGSAVRRLLEKLRLGTYRPRTERKT